MKKEQLNNLTPLYTFKGTVVHGKGLGRSVGMPTANVYNAPMPSIPFGVYSTIIKIDDEAFMAVTNVGTRPSVDNMDIVTVEAHIIDFDRDIYDKEVTLDFYKLIRGVKKFPSLRDVKIQVDKDIEFTRKLFSYE